MRSVHYFVEHDIGTAPRPMLFRTSQTFKTYLAATAWARTEAMGRWRVIRLEVHRIAVARGGRS